MPEPLQRRDLLRKGLVAGGLVWASPVMESVISPAAAQSAPSSTATAGLFKSGRGVLDPLLVTICTAGAATDAGRGSVLFTRTESPATICATITLATGASALGRQVYILQSTANQTCLGGVMTSVGAWAAIPLLGPQMFCAPIAPGATNFVVALQVSGGGGNDGWSSSPPVSLP